ncbi:MAG: transporter, ATP-binding protein [Clostridia bacterium]|jgi:ABC-2 type transport system ATP-binding protein|nr:transporter, ATP-binding protein [Clostridia bacterium]
MNSEKVLEIRGLDKSYGKKQVLFDINLDVYQGEIFAVLGVNGAGKTTLLECIEGLRKWQGGEISVQGISPSKEPIRLKQILGIQLQSSALPKDIKVKEAVELFAREHHVPYDLGNLEFYGLANKIEKKYSELSTGQKRRLHLMLALLHDPGIVILDEPSAGLDVEGKLALYEQILDLKKKGKTIIITTHDMQEVEKLCDRVAFIVNGRIPVIDNVDNLRNADFKSIIYIKTRNNSLKEGFNSENAENICIGEDYSKWKCKNVNMFLIEAAQYIHSHNDYILDLYFEKESFEEIFLSIAKGGNE